MLWLLGLVGLWLAVKQSGQTTNLSRQLQTLSGSFSPHATRPTTNAIAIGNRKSAGVPGLIGGPPVRDYPGPGGGGPPGIFVPMPSPAPARPTSPAPPVRYDAPPPSTVYLEPASAPPTFVDVPAPIYVAPVPPSLAPAEPRERQV